MATTQPVTDWKKEWFEIEDATYLNTSAQAVMPRVSVRAVQASLEAKKFPHHVDDSVFFNFNLTAMDASVDFVLRAGPDLVHRHNRKLIDLLFEHLPKDCVPASPLDSTQRGPYGCFTGQTLQKTAELYKGRERKMLS